MWIGIFYADPSSSSESWVPWYLSGWVYAAPLMTILLVHEMGHYLAARRRYLDVTPPYFIPAPPPIITGTFGAFIKIRSPITDRRVLVEVGAWGPVAGGLVALPLLALGMFLSSASPGPPPPTTSLSFGSSLIVELFCLIRFGDISQNLVVSLHPTAMAAWFGLFVTAMNLLPIGQLDGGHVAYALFGPRLGGLISKVAFVLLIPLGIAMWPGWLVFGVLTFFLGIRHPPPLDPVTPLDRKGRLLGWVAVILFVLTFVPVPFAILD